MQIAKILENWHPPSNGEKPAMARPSPTVVGAGRTGGANDGAPSAPGVPRRRPPSAAKPPDSSLPPVVPYAAI
ncbi:MAG: hypothetical protein LBR80_18395 [Deltaproteobacteria bacterium]|nr:hypothetical protein [Deltaproteobacteria bacterium]